MKQILFLIALLGIHPAFVFADSGAQLYERGRATYFSSKSLPQKALKLLSYRKAAADLRRFIDTFPNHPRIPEALFNLGSIYKELAETNRDRDDAATSIHYFKKLIQTSRTDRLADDAWYGIYQVCARVFQEDRCAKEAKQKILKEYPTGDMARSFSSEAPVKPVFNAEKKLVGFTQEEVDGKSRFNFSVQGSPVFASNYLNPSPEQNLPARFYFNLEDAKLADDLTTKSFGSNGPVSQIRFGKNEKGLRIVLDLNAGITANQISATNENGDIRVEISGGQSAEKVAEPEMHPDAPALPEIKASESLTVGSSFPNRFKIVLDAGHGGEDPGARGKKGTQEKDICLAIVMQLKELLSQRREYDLFITRSDDRFIALSDRTKYANQVEGDLFVSIHANASPRRGAEGVSTYFLDNHDDAESLRVAMRENQEPLMLTPSPNSPEADSQYLEIMKASMVKNFHTVQSTEFAQKVQLSLMKELRSDYDHVEDLGVKSARFYVLTGAQMPAVLVETSFISNPTEEKRLRDKKYQKSIARAVAQGIDQFFRSSVGRGDHAALYQH